MYFFAVSRWMPSSRATPRVDNPQRKALIRNFVEGIEVVGDEATLTYTVPMPSDGATSESASVLDFVKSGPPTHTVDTTIFEMWLGNLSTHQGLSIPVA